METQENIKEAEHEICECPGCGANIKYDPTTLSLRCEYCGSIVKLDGTVSDQELEFLNATDDDNWGRETKMIHCQNCGANNVISSTEITNTCPFCGSNVAIDETEIVGRKPNRVIPFCISHDDAITNYRKWLKKRFWAPGKIKKQIPNASVNGIYLPSWTYDSKTTSSYVGRLGKHYTVTVGSGKNQHTETRTRWFQVSGVHSYQADDILVYAGEKINQEKLTKLSPYGTNDSFIYDARYLLGFSAEHYSVSLNDGWATAKKIIENNIKAQILTKYDYDVVDYLTVKTSHNNITYKYVILPVWNCYYTFNKKKYDFLVNGESGKVIGKSPVSAVKVTIATIIGIALIILIAYFWLTNQ